MKTSQFENILIETLTSDLGGESTAMEHMGVEDLLTFEEAGLLTHDNGIVFRMENGSEFHMSITKIQ
jgi:hypothetical protein